MALLEKTVNAFAKVISSVALLIVTLKSLTDKDNVLDFFENTFKEPLAFVVFVFMLIGLVLTLSIEYKEKRNQVGRNRDAEGENEQIKKFNFKIYVSRIIFATFSILSIAALFYFEFKTENLGILQGAYGTDERFISNLVPNVRDSSKPMGYKFVYAKSLKYREETEKKIAFF